MELLLALAVQFELVFTAEHGVPALSVLRVHRERPVLDQIVDRPGGRAALGGEVRVGHHVKAVARQVSVDDQRIPTIDRLQKDLHGAGLGLDLEDVLLFDRRVAVEKILDEIVLGHRLREIESLDQIAVAGTEKTVLLLGLDPLRDRPDVQPVGEEENALEDDAFPLVLAVPLQEGAVDLDLVRGGVGDQTQRGEPAAEIVDRELEAVFAEPRDGRAHQFLFLGDGGFGDLHHDQPAVDPVGVHDLGKVRRHILLVEVPAGEVDRDRHRLDMKRLQPFNERADLFDHVPVQHGDGAGLLHRGQKLLRQDDVAVFPHPADQGFGGLHSAGRGVDLRLIIHFQLPPVHRLHSCQDVADDIIVHFFLSVPPVAYFGCAHVRSSAVFVFGVLFA